MVAGRGGSVAPPRTAAWAMAGPSVCDVVPVRGGGTWMSTGSAPSSTSSRSVSLGRTRTSRIVQAPKPSARTSIVVGRPWAGAGIPDQVKRPEALVEAVSPRLVERTRAPGTGAPAESTTDPWTEPVVADWASASSGGGATASPAMIARKAAHPTPNQVRAKCLDNFAQALRYRRQGVMHGTGRRHTAPDQLCWPPSALSRAHV